MVNFLRSDMGFVIVVACWIYIFYRLAHWAMDTIMVLLSCQ
jgi:hypothetical protein